jgi:3-oxoacid CoA-transferase subunit B
MDLSSGARRIVALMTHATKEGEPKLVAECAYPLTARGVVSRIITDLAVVDVTPAGFSLVECAPGVPPDRVRALTGAPLA